MKYNKLIRDKIPNLIESKGQKCRTHVADNEEYWEKLKEKLQEEVVEFQKDENIDELADIYEVLDAIVAHKQFDADEIKKVQQEKSSSRGGFTEKIILEES